MDVLKFEKGTCFSSTAIEKGKYFEVVARNDHERYYKVKLWLNNYLAAKNLKIKFESLIMGGDSIIIINNKNS